MRFLYAAVETFGPKLGFRGITRFANVLGFLLWYLVGSRRTLAINAIAQHLSLPVDEARRIARASFTQNCLSFLELLAVGRVDETFCNVTLKEATPGAFARALQHDGPIIGITGHLGAWELLAGYMGTVVRAQRAEALVVVRRNKNPRLHALITHFREATGVKVVEHRHAVFTVLKALKKNGFAAFLVDHNCPRNEAIFLPFLRETAAVNIGPAVLAVRSNAAILPVFMTRDAQGGYVLHVDEMLFPDALEGTRDDKIKQVAEFYTQQAEKYVTHYPEQWFWMHKRWKTRPESS